MFHILSKNLLSLSKNACASPLEAYGSSVQSNIILGKCHPQANTNGVYIATLQIPNLHQAHSDLTQHTRNQQTNILDVQIISLAMQTK
jgi:hypothetical protein